MLNISAIAEGQNMNRWFNPIASHHLEVLFHEQLSHQYHFLEMVSLMWISMRSAMQRRGSDAVWGVRDMPNLETQTTSFSFRRE